MLYFVPIRKGMITFPGTSGLVYDFSLSICVKMSTFICDHVWLLCVKNEEEIAEKVYRADISPQ